MFMGSNYRTGLRVTEIASIIKKQLKLDFPSAKFSVTSDSYSITIALMEFNQEIRTVNEDDFQVNGTIELNKKLNDTGKFIFLRLKDLGNSFRYDDSDVQTDYFDTNFYLKLEVGKWDKPFVVRQK